MSAVPRYLALARKAMETTPPTQHIRERSEESETSRRFLPGGRYEVKGPLVGVIHRTTASVETWREEHGLPRAGLMTIEGELVLVADVRATVRTGRFDVIGVPKVGPR